MESVSWQILDKYFTENTHNLVAHHLDSYNDFFSSGINNIFKDSKFVTEKNSRYYLLVN